MSCENCLEGGCDGERECVKRFVFIGGKSGADEGEAAGSASNGVERR